MSLAAEVQQAAKVEQNRRRTPEQTVLDPYALTPDELARIVSSRVRAKVGSGTRRDWAIRAEVAKQVSRLSEYEQDALAQEVTVSLLPGCRRGTPREVLRYIDWAQRNVASAARAERIPRGTVGRTLIDSRIARIMSESRAWRDTCDSYRVRERADRERDHSLVASVHAADFSEPLSDDEKPSAVYLAVAARSVEQHRLSRAAVSLDADELAANLAARLARSETERRAIRAAVIRITATPSKPSKAGKAGKPSKAGSRAATEALAQLAAATGRALKSVRNDATDGLRILSGLTYRDLREAVADCSQDDSLSQAGEDAAELPLASWNVSEAIARALRERQARQPMLRPMRVSLATLTNDRRVIGALAVNRQLVAMLAPNPAKRPDDSRPVRDGRRVIHAEVIAYPTIDDLGALAWGTREKVAGDDPAAWTDDYVPSVTVAEVERLAAGKVAARVR